MINGGNAGMVLALGMLLAAWALVAIVKVVF